MLYDLPLIKKYIDKRGPLSVLVHEGGQFQVRRCGLSKTAEALEELELDGLRAIVGYYNPDISTQHLAEDIEAYLQARVTD